MSLEGGRQAGRERGGRGGREGGSEGERREGREGREGGRGGMTELMAPQYLNNNHVTYYVIT